MEIRTMKQFLDFPIIEGKQNKHDKLLLLLLANSTYHDGVRYLKKENVNASQLAKKVGKARSYTARAIAWLIKQEYIEAQDDRYVFPKLETGSYSRIDMSLVDKLCAMPDKAVVVFAYMKKFKALSETFSKEWLLEKGLCVSPCGDSRALLNNVFEKLEEENLVNVAVQTKEGKYSNTAILFVAEHLNATKVVKPESATTTREEEEVATTKPTVATTKPTADPSKIVDLEAMFEPKPEPEPTVKPKKDYVKEAYDFG